MKSFPATMFAMLVTAAIAQEPAATVEEKATPAPESAATTTLQDEGTDEIDLEEDDSAIAAKKPQIKVKQKRPQQTAAQQLAPGGLGRKETLSQKKDADIADIIGQHIKMERCHFVMEEIQTEIRDQDRRNNQTPAPFFWQIDS